MSSRQAFTLALVLHVGACLLPSDPEVEVSVSVGSLVVRPSVPVDVAVTVTNFGPGPVEVSRYACPPNYEVFDDRGDWVGPPGVICAAIAIPPMTLDAGGVFTFEHSWDGEIFRDGEDVFEDGTFRIQGKVWVAEFGVVRSRTVEVHVMSDGSGAMAR